MSGALVSGTFQVLAVRLYGGAVLAVGDSEERQPTPSTKTATGDDLGSRMRGVIR